MGVPLRFAVMGNPIAHSLSPMIHRLFAEQTGCVLSYDKMKIDLPAFEPQVAQFFDEGGLGLNITQPFKQRAFLISQDKTARCWSAGAANTLWRDKTGRLQADNTDGVGLLRDLTRHMDLPGQRVLLLGAGGAARGILAPLLASGIQSLTIVNRTLSAAHALCQAFEHHAARSLLTVADIAELNAPFDIILNATSASLQDNPLALPSRLIMPPTVCYDLSYRLNGDTPFVAWARAQGSQGIDGLGMLVEQAAEAFFIWHGVMPNTTRVLACLVRKVTHV